MTNDGFIEYALDMFALQGKAHEMFELDKAVERDRDTGIGTKAHENADSTTKNCERCNRTASRECRYCGKVLCDDCICPFHE